jgi:hypothetical protein
VESGWRVGFVHAHGDHDAGRGGEAGDRPDGGTDAVQPEFATHHVRSLRLTKEVGQGPLALHTRHGSAQALERGNKRVIDSARRNSPGVLGNSGEIHLSVVNMAI